MKTKLLDKTGKLKKELDLPKNFSVKIRPDILLKVFEAKKLEKMQPQGSKPGSGAGYSASGIIRHRRHVWKTGYGKGISRVPRKIMSRSGSSFNWVGATVASTVGGRKAHSPKSLKNLTRKINKKEFLIAFNSALSGTIDEKAIEKKYNKKIESGLVFDSAILDVKTKDFIITMKILFKDNFNKIIKTKSIRAGRGKLRGRKYKSNAGLLFVISSEEKMKRSGIDVVKVKELDITNLAPNGVAGRITCYTERAIEEIEKVFGRKY